MNRINIGVLYQNAAGKTADSFPVMENNLPDAMKGYSRDRMHPSLKMPDTGI